MRYLRLVLLLFVVLMGHGCSLLDDRREAREQLRDHRDIWNAHEISAYQYQLQRGCFCPAWLYPARVVVRGDTVHTVLQPETGDTLRHPGTQRPAVEVAPGAHDTIGQLFAGIEKALDEDYHRLSVYYNDRFGYPERIHVEMSENATDDRVTTRVRRFQPLVHAEDR
jgi:hypothetical protein